ncbi:MAG: pyridoxamine 5'-phosphate oxidase family protein [Candidatus Nanopelagicales bacterium]
MSARVDTSMTPAEIEHYLAEASTMILTTIGPDGVPDPVGMWFVLRDGDIWMRTYGASQKAVNIARDPRVAVLVESGESYAELRGVQLTGVMEPVTDEDIICDIAVQLLVKYEGLALEYVEAAREAYRSKAPKQVALRLRPERTVSWDHRKLIPSS